MSIEILPFIEGRMFFVAFETLYRIGSNPQPTHRRSVYMIFYNPSSFQNQFFPKWSNSFSMKIKVEEFLLRISC